MSRLGKSWGPHTWYILHYISLTWHKSLIPFYIKFIHLLKETIPCYTCYTNFKSKLRKPNNSIEYNCKEKERMIKWLVNLHNDVNKSNRTRIYTVDEVKNIYLKNNIIHFNNRHVARFIKEFILYNIDLGGNRKKKSIKLLIYLAYIYPSIKRRIRLITFVRRFRSRSIRKWINGYLKCLK